MEMYMSLETQIDGKCDTLRKIRMLGISIQGQKINKMDGVHMQKRYNKRGRGGGVDGKGKRDGIFLKDKVLHSSRKLCELLRPRQKEKQRGKEDEITTSLIISFKEQLFGIGCQLNGDTEVDPDHI